MNPLHQQLEILNDILDAGYTTAELCDRYNISERTLKRHLAEARQLGAELETSTVVSPRTGRREYFWICTNRFQIEERGLFRAWLKAERERAEGEKLA